MAVDEYELAQLLDMMGISAGAHIIKVEMYKMWSTGKRLLQEKKEYGWIIYLRLKNPNSF